MLDSQPVLIVGGGPTGLLMALAMARAGVPCRIIDKLAVPSPFSKAVAIQSRTLELFDRLGIVADFLQAGQRVERTNITANGHPLVQINLAELASPYPCILDLSQDETERILTRHLAAQGVTVERGIALVGLIQDAQEVTATLHHADGREETVNTPWLIGCDGAHSAVRHLLGMTFTGAAYPETWSLADVEIAWSLPEDEIQIFLDTTGIFAAFPLGAGRFRLIAELPATPATPEDAPSLAAFQTAANTHVPVPVTLSTPRWLAYFHINRRQAEHYQQGRVFLAGDAMHIHSPAGGQGMNTGLQDVANLAWKLALVIHGQATAALLATYEEERHPVAASVLQMTDLMMKAVTMRNPLAQQVRNRLVPLLAGQEVLQQRAARQVAELNINYRKSTLSVEAHTSLVAPGGPKAGDRAPNAAPLLNDAGSEIHLFDLLRGPHFVLLLFMGKDGDRLVEIAADVQARYGDLIATHIIMPGEVLPDLGGVTVLRDTQHAAQREYGAGESLYLLRPDGYIGLRSHPADSARLFRYLAHVLDKANS